MNDTKSSPSIKSLVDDNLLRDVPGWEGAPVPACFGGDPRSLTFCCHPSFALTFSFKCQRDRLLKEVGLTKKEFVKLKDDFSREHDWGGKVCFQSISYCCMRRGGCPGNRDNVLKEKYPGKSWDQVLEIYFSLKRELALKLLRACRNKEVVELYIKCEEHLY